MERTKRTAREIADSFRIRASATIEICAGAMGLTDKQSDKLQELEKRFKGDGKPLTNNMLLERLDLINKRDNPELPEGAKTHCKKWLKSFLFNRREELNNKYVNKGNESEEDGFTLMAIQLGLGMVYKNTERRSNDFSVGECDLNHKGVVYDNKCSWSLDTFPMFETEIPDDRYWWQLQNYSTNWDCDKLCLCYTLISTTPNTLENFLKWESDHNERYKIAERMVFSEKEFEEAKMLFFPNATLDTFIEIPEDKRIKAFYFEPEQWAKDMIKKRSYMCREYIYNLLINSGYK